MREWWFAEPTNVGLSPYKQSPRTIAYSLDYVNATKEDHEEYVSWRMIKKCPTCFFCNLERSFKSDCPQF